MKSKRGRNFACILYPDQWSLDTFNDIKEIVRGWHTQVFISPCHDSDHNKDGVIEKKHYHLLVRFDGCKSADQVSELFHQIGGIGLEFVDNFRGYARYLCHLDEDPLVKTHYDPEQVWSSTDVTYADICQSSADQLALAIEICDFIDSYDITLFAELVRYANKNNPEWARYLHSGHTMFFTSYMKSREYGKLHSELYKLGGQS